MPFEVGFTHDSKKKKNLNLKSTLTKYRSSRQHKMTSAIHWCIWDYQISCHTHKKKMIICDIFCKFFPFLNLMRVPYELGASSLIKLSNILLFREQFLDVTSTDADTFSLFAKLSRFIIHVVLHISKWLEIFFYWEKKMCQNLLRFFFLFCRKDNTTLFVIGWNLRWKCQWFLKYVLMFVTQF